MSKPSPAGLASRVRALSALTAAALCVALLAPAAAFAATAPPFQPTLVIADDVFRASGSLSAADIQAFLEKYPGVLDTTLAPRHADGSMQPVSLLIWEVSQEFSINPKVLLTMLQKEQGLLTKTAPTQTTLDWAFGFGCYDGSTPETRDPKYKGLGNQIWWAAASLDVYAESTWKPGLVRTPYVCADCVTDRLNPVRDYAFVPQNLATYKLYVYTPHSHNSVIGGGNYLFWKVYWTYFDEGPLAPASLKPVYRFYNKGNGTHFYTASEAERYTVIRKLAAIYTYEGPAYWVNTANATNSLPLYRFYNQKKGTHFYTASESEKQNVIATLSGTFTYEGPVYNVSSSAENATSMFRFYNRRTGTHFYTASAEERDSVMAKLAGTYTYEGVAYYIGN